MNASQRRWVLGVLWLSVIISAVMAVRAPRAFDAGAATLGAAMYAIFATEFARRTR